MIPSCKSVQLAQPIAQLCPLEFVHCATPLVGVALAQARFRVSKERKKERTTASTLLRIQTELRPTYPKC